MHAEAAKEDCEEDADDLIADFAQAASKLYGQGAVFGQTPIAQRMAAGYDLDSGAGILMALAAVQATAPEGLQVRPGPGFFVRGFPGGPFSITGQSSYVLTNVGASSLNWTAILAAAWRGSPISVTALT